MKFNESENHWDGLETKLVNESLEFYFYDVELNAFSSFVVVGEEKEEIVEEKSWISEKWKRVIEFVKNLFSKVSEFVKSNLKYVLGGVGVVMLGIAGFVLFRMFRKKKIKPKNNRGKIKSKFFETEAPLTWFSLTCPFKTEKIKIFFKNHWKLLVGILGGGVVILLGIIDNVYEFGILNKIWEIIVLGANLMKTFGIKVWEIFERVICAIKELFVILLEKLERLVESFT